MILPAHCWYLCQNDLLSVMRLHMCTTVVNVKTKKVPFFTKRRKQIFVLLVFHFCFCMCTFCTNNGQYAVIHVYLMFREQQVQSQGKMLCVIWM